MNYVRTTAGHAVILDDSGDWTMGTLYDLKIGAITGKDSAKR